jgi:hypothetical protein
MPGSQRHKTRPRLRGLYPARPKVMVGTEGCRCLSDLMRLIVALAVSLQASSTVAQVDLGNARHLNAECQRVVDNRPLDSTDEAVLQGVCIGIVYAIRQISDQFPSHLRFCPPSDVGLLQLLHTATAHINAQPDRPGEDFITLAIESYRNTWPCEKR